MFDENWVLSTLALLIWFILWLGRGTIVVYLLGIILPDLISMDIYSILACSLLITVLKIDMGGL